MVKNRKKKVAQPSDVRRIEALGCGYIGPGPSGDDAAGQEERIMSRLGDRSLIRWGSSVERVNWSPDAFRALRRCHGLSQQRIAELIGVVGSTVSRWERGTAEPSFALGVRLARALEVDPWNLCRAAR